MIWHQPSGVNPSPVPVCYCHNSNQLLLLAHSVQKSSFPGRHTPRTLPFGLLFTSGMKHKSLNKKQGPPNLTSRRSVKDSSIRNLCSFVKWESQAFFTMLASSCICLLTKKKKSLLITISSYSNVFQKKVTMVLGMYMPEGQMEKQGKD